MTDAELYEALRERGDIVEERVTFPGHVFILTLRNGTIKLKGSKEIKKAFLRGNLTKNSLKHDTNC